MKPQILDLDSEVLAEFKNSFNAALARMIMNIIEKHLPDGEVGGKLKIEIEEKLTEDGEVILVPTIKPDVHMKIGGKAKADLGKKDGMILRMTPCGQAVVASNQITIDDLIEADRKGA